MSAFYTLCVSKNFESSFFNESSFDRIFSFVFSANSGSEDRNRILMRGRGGEGTRGGTNNAENVSFFSRSYLLIHRRGGCR